MRRPLQVVNSQLRRHAEPNNTGHILCARPPATLLPAANDQGLQIKCTLYKECASAFWAAKLVCRQAEHIHPERSDIERDTARRLHGVTMNQGAALMR